MYSDDSLSSTNTTSTLDGWFPDSTQRTTNKSNVPFNPSGIVSMIDESSDSNVETPTPIATPTGILKFTASQPAIVSSTTSPKQSARSIVRGTRGVMFSTTVTVDDGSEVVRLNCTLDESELGKHQVPPTEKECSTNKTAADRAARSKLNSEKPTFPRAMAKLPVGPMIVSKSGSPAPTEIDVGDASGSNQQPMKTFLDEETATTTTTNVEDSVQKHTTDVIKKSNVTTAAPEPPPRKSSHITTNANGDTNPQLLKPTTTKKDYENLDIIVSCSNCV